MITDPLLIIVYIISFFFIGMCMGYLLEWSQNFYNFMLLIGFAWIPHTLYSIKDEEINVLGGFVEFIIVLPFMVLGLYSGQKLYKKVNH